FTRKDQDAYAMETLTRARKAVEGGTFKAEIAAVTLAEKAGPRVIANDEHPLKVDPAKIPGLKPAFRANGTITPTASSANADGGADSRQALAGGPRGPADPRGNQGARDPQPGAAVVHDRADPGDPKAARQGRLDRRRCRPVRDQRSLCRRGDGRPEGSRNPPR